MALRSELLSSFVAQHVPGAELYPLAGDASFRRYIRVRHGAGFYMLMDAPPEKETLRPFMAVCNSLIEGGFSAPHIISSDEAAGFLLLEDLGDDTFSRLLRADVSSEAEYYQAAVELLASWHTRNFSARSMSLPLYDLGLLMRETLLFSDWFLPQLLDGSVLVDAQKNYVMLWQDLLEAVPLEKNQFVHRDYHADNLMWLPTRSGVKKIGLLDFQDAVRGDAAYDLVSLLEDARRDVPVALAQQMIAYYMRQSGTDSERFSLAYALLAAQRNSKIIGIFVRLAVRDGKGHYLDFLPRVWAHLMRDVEHPKLSALKQWLDRYVPREARGRLAIRKDAQMLGLVS